MPGRFIMWVLFICWGTVMWSQDSAEQFYNKAIHQYSSGQMEAAVQSLTRAKQLGKDSPELYLLMARIKHAAGSFLEAAFFYKEFIRRTTKEDLKAEALRSLKSCAAQAATVGQESTLLVQSFGEGVNSRANERNPILDPVAGNTFHYNSISGPRSVTLSPEGMWVRDTVVFGDGFDRRIYLHDVYGTERNLLVSKEKNGRSAVEILFKVKNGWASYELPAQLFAGARDIVAADSAEVYFSALQPESETGYDIYRTVYKNNRWQAPERLGPHINSPFDERSPYPVMGTDKIIFSSNRPYGKGGYDLYEGNMAEPQDARPLKDLNSSMNDMALRLQGDGQMAFFQSDRLGGTGQYDLYFAYLEKPYMIRPHQARSLACIPDANNEVSMGLIEESTARKETVPVRQVIFYRDSYDLINESTGGDRFVHGDERKTDRVHILAFADPDEPGLPEYRLYNSMKRAVIVGETLSLTGRNRDSIILESYGGNYPVVRPGLKGEIYDSLFYLNKRIEIEPGDYITAASGLYEEIMPELPAARDRRYELFRSVREDLYFSVRVGRSHGMFKNAALRLYDDIYTRKEGLDAPTDYYIGLLTDFESAARLADELSALQGLEPEIFAFMAGRKLDTKEAEMRAVALPELLRFIEKKKNQ